MKRRLVSDRLIPFYWVCLWALDTCSFSLQSPSSSFLSSVKIDARCRRDHGVPVTMYCGIEGGDVDTTHAILGGDLDYAESSSTVSIIDDDAPSLDLNDDPLTLMNSRDSHEDDHCQHEDRHEPYRMEPYFSSRVPSMVPSPMPQQNVIEGGVGLSRRQWLEGSAVLFFGGSIVGGSLLNGLEVNEPKPAPIIRVTPSGTKVTVSTPSPTTASTTMTTKMASRSASPSGKLSPVNITQIARETNINVTMDCDNGCVSVDAQNYTKIQTKEFPTWYPQFLIPPPKVIKEISNVELLVAATVAGAATEMVRTSLLYPLQTVKTRIQMDVHNCTVRPPSLEDQIAKLGTNVRRHVRGGDLYAGITPSLLISVPATGVYFGVRDVSKRMLRMMPGLTDTEIVLAAALVADVISLCFRTPADALALRLQDQNADVGDWVVGSLKRIPSVVITDLPYLLSKILLGRQLIQGNISIDRYAEFAIISAVVAAFLTTPFDVARTRILIDSDGDSTNGKDGGSGDGVLRTMIAITKEGRGGLANLFAGWLERVLYLGIGRAWLEPLQIIAYVGIRDSILLQWF